MLLCRQRRKAHIEVILFWHNEWLKIRKEELIGTIHISRLNIYILCISNFILIPLLCCCLNKTNADRLTGPKIENTTLHSFPLRLKCLRKRNWRTLDVGLVSFLEAAWSSKYLISMLCRDLVNARDFKLIKFILQQTFKT